PGGSARPPASESDRGEGQVASGERLLAATGSTGRRHGTPPDGRAYRVVSDGGGQDVVAGLVRAQAQGADHRVVGGAGGQVRALVGLVADVAVVGDRAGVALRVEQGLVDAVV